MAKSSTEQIFSAEDYFNFSRLLLDVKTTDRSIYIDINGYEPTGDTLLRAPENHRVSHHRIIDNWIHYNHKQTDEIKDKLLAPQESAIYNKIFNKPKLKDYVKDLLIYSRYFKAEHFNPGSEVYDYTQYRIMIFFAEISYYYGQYINDLKANNSNIEMHHDKEKRKQEKSYLKKVIKTISAAEAIKDDPRFKEIMGINLTTAPEVYLSSSGQMPKPAETYTYPPSISPLCRGTYEHSTAITDTAEKKIKELKIVGRCAKGNAEGIAERLLMYRIIYNIFQIIGDDNLEAKDINFAALQGYTDKATWVSEREQDKDLSPLNLLQLIMEFSSLIAEPKDKKTYRAAIKKIRSSFTHIKIPHKYSMLPLTQEDFKASLKECEQDLRDSTSL